MADENTLLNSDLESRYEKYKGIIKNFTLMSDIFMRNVFKKRECLEYVLQVIMEKQDLHVIDQIIQKDYKNLQGRSAVMDCVARDSTGKQFDVEIQQDNEGASPKRARYHSGLMDMNTLNPGQDFEELPESYVIFITRDDILGYGLPIYHIDRQIKELNEAFQDEAHIIYVNSRNQDDTELGRLMHDLHCKNAGDMYSSILADEAHLLSLEKLSVLLTWSEHRPVIFSSDSEDVISPEELDRSIVERLENLPGLQKFHLTNRIRTNAELSTFIQNMMHLPEKRSPRWYPNIAVVYAGNGRESENLMNDFVRQGYQRRTTEGSGQLDAQAVRDEEKIVVLLDEQYYYDEKGYLRFMCSSEKDFSVRRLFHLLNQAKESLALVVKENMEVYHIDLRDAFQEAVREFAQEGTELWKAWYYDDFRAYVPCIYEQKYLDLEKYPLKYEGK